MRLKKIPGRMVIGIVILTISVIIFSSFAGAAGKNDSIGYVDMERLQNELPDFIRLKDTFKDKQAEYNYYRGYLLSQQQTAAKDFEKKATAEKAGKNETEQAAIDKKYQDELKKKNDELAGLLQQKESEITRYINEQQSATQTKVDKIIAAVADEKKLTLVLTKSARLYGGTDITQAVIDKAKKQDQDSQKTGSNEKTQK